MWVLGGGGERLDADQSMQNKMWYEILPHSWTSVHLSDVKDTRPRHSWLVSKQPSIPHEHQVRAHRVARAPINQQLPQTHPLPPETTGWRATDGG